MRVSRFLLLFTDGYHGVIREVWQQDENSLTSFKTQATKSLRSLKELASKSLPILSHEINTFEAPENVLDDYGQRLSAYLQVNTKLSISCIN